MSTIADAPPPRHPLVPRTKYEVTASAVELKRHQDNFVAVQVVGRLETNTGQQSIKSPSFTSTSVSLIGTHPSVGSRIATEALDSSVASISEGHRTIKI